MIRKNVCKNVIMTVLLMMMQNAYCMEPNTVIGCVTPADYPGCSFNNVTAMAITPDGKKAYVCNRNNNSVSVIDVETDTVIDCVTPNNYPGCGLSLPGAIAITPDSKKAYIANTGTNTVSVIDVETDTVIGCVTPTNYPGCRFSFPSAIAITPDNKKAYVCNLLGNSVSVIDVETDTVIDCIDNTSGYCPFNRPNDIAIRPDGKTAYVVNQSNTVSIIDVASNTVIDCVTPNPGCPFSFIRTIAITPDGTKAYVGSNEQGITYTTAVNIIDIASNAVIGCVENTSGSCGFINPHPIAITPDGTTAYVCNPNSVSIIDVASDTVIGCVENTSTYCGFHSPNSIAITPDGTKAYVANNLTSTISIIFIKAPTPSILPLPPSSASGCKTKNVFLLQTDFINNITWTAPTSGATPVAYNIYRDPALTQLVTIIPANGPLQYYDHGRNPNTIYSYYIVSVDGSGNMSTATSVTVTKSC